jgi:fructokinase
LDNRTSAYLSLHSGSAPHAAGARTLVAGEVLWDCFPDSRRLGGAPLNFAFFLKRLQHLPLLVSAVGTDSPGEEARSAIAALGLDTTFLRSTDRYQTGRAIVRLGPGDETSFTIDRPAAYDAVELSAAETRTLVQWGPTWFYYGTLFASRARARDVLRALLDAIPNATRFYDLNLRPGFESPELVLELLQAADVVKLNERELSLVSQWLELPSDPEGFSREGSRRFQWRAAAVTLGARGCAMLVDGHYAEGPGVAVDVVDPVGAGDAFAAAFMHGIVSNWPVASIVRFANRAGAFIVRAHGAIPDLMPEDPLLS